MVLELREKGLSDTAVATALTRHLHMSLDEIEAAFAAADEHDREQAPRRR